MNKCVGSNLSKNSSPEHGPLPGLTWENNCGRRTYYFVDAKGDHVMFGDLTPRDDDEGEMMSVGAVRGDVGIYLTKDMAYWLSEALMVFANIGQLP